MFTLQPSLTRRQLLLSSLALLPAMKTHAQGTPAISTDDDMTVALMLDVIPGKRLNTFLARYTFVAGGEAPAFNRVGTALMMVESGALRLTSDESVRLHRASPPEPAALREVAAGGIVLDAGDGALVPDKARMSLRNDGGEPATVLMLIAYAPYREFSYVHPTALPRMNGVTRQVIGLGTGAFEEVPAVMVLGRDVVRPGGSAFSSTFGGIEIGTIASGGARAKFQSGTGWMTPDVLDRAEPPKVPGEVRINTGDMITLDAADGYVSDSSAITWRATGDGPLVLLRGQIIPIPVAG